MGKENVKVTRAPMPGEKLAAKVGVVGGKGKGKNTEGWWECPVALCTKHHGGQLYWNHPGRNVCQACQVPRAAAAANKAANKDQDLQKLREAAAED